MTPTTAPATHPAPFPGICTECSQPYADGDAIVWLTGGADRHAACPTDAYRTLVRTGYELSRTIEYTANLDARLALHRERQANAAAARAIALSGAEKAVVDGEEFARAYPALSIRRAVPVQRRSTPWRRAS